MRPVGKGILFLADFFLEPLKKWRVNRIIYQQTGHDLQRRLEPAEVVPGIPGRGPVYARVDGHGLGVDVQ